MHTTYIPVAHCVLLIRTCMEAFTSVIASACVRQQCYCISHSLMRIPHCCSAEETCPAGLHHSGFSCGNHQPKIFFEISNVLAASCCLHQWWRQQEAAETFGISAREPWMLLSCYLCTLYEQLNASCVSPVQHPRIQLLMCSLSHMNLVCIWKQTIG